jgi:hypothetical protein
MGDADDVPIALGHRTTRAIADIYAGPWRGGDAWETWWLSRSCTYSHGLRERERDVHARRHHASGMGNEAGFRADK